MGLKTESTLKNFKSGGLAINLSGDDSTATMNWFGQCDSTELVVELTDYLENIGDSIDGRSLTINFTALEYINSSTVSPIVRFLKTLNSLSIKTNVIYDVNSKWQSASFKALSSMSRMFSDLTITGT